MCGINGFTGADPAALRRMHAATKHRGPDDEGFLEAPGISLAHNRLSIIDLSPLGRQPMATPDGRFSIVFNGEIYNYQDLRAELERLGERFTSRSDTEVLLRAFARWGRDALPRLNGIFAFAVWDRDREELTLVRDQMGVKPLYYAWEGKRLVFSSEIKALLAHPVPREIDPDALNLYFRFLYVPGPRTMYRGVAKLQPGHLLSVRAGAAETVRWWRIREGEYLADPRVAAQAVRDLALDAVRAQLVSDRPLGVFLSGGVDSTAVLGMMRRVVSGPIRTFSVGYEATAEEEKYNADFRLAERTAAYFGTEHHPLRVSARDVAACFEDVVRAMDEPVSNHVQPSTYLLAKAAKPLITVALGGDGGDELFGGYDRYWYSAFVDDLRRLPLPLRNRPALALLGRAFGKPGLPDKVAVPQGVERFLSYMGEKDGRVAAFLQPEADRPEAARAQFAPYFAEPWKDFTNRLMAVDAETWLPDESLMRTDKMTMVWSLEERVPLLDPRLVALAFRIPSRMKLGSRTQGKRILREAFREFLPPFILRERKRGFFSPAAKWLRTDLLPLARETLSDGYAAGSEEFLDLAAARRILDDHVAARRYGLTSVWAIMTFQAWYRSSFRTGAR